MKKWIYFLLLVCAQSHAQDVFVVQNKKIDNKPMQYTGVLVPGDLVEISSPVHATVKAKYATYGDQVNKDDILFELSSPDLLLKLNDEKMKLFEYRQNLEKLQNWDTSSEVLQAQYNVSRAEDEYEHDKDRFEQTQKLYNAGLVSKEEYASDERSYKHALNHFNQTTRHLNDVKKKGDEKYLELAKLKVAQCESQIKLLNDKIQALTIRAPITGIFLPPLRNENAKDWTHASFKRAFQEDQCLGIVAQNDHVYVQIKVDEFDIVNIQKEQEAIVKLAAFSTKTLKGKIQDINLLNNKSNHNQPTANFDVKIKLEDVDAQFKEKMLLGMTATVNLTRPPLQGLFVPKQAIVFQDEEAFVNVIENENQALHKVELGPTSNDQVLVNKGLKAGDKVVVIS